MVVVGCCSMLLVMLSLMFFDTWFVTELKRSRTHPRTGETQQIVSTTMKPSTSRSTLPMSVAEAVDERAGSVMSAADRSVLT